MHQPASFKTPEALELLRGLQLDALVVVAYGLILPPAALQRAQARLLQHPCLAAAALARRGADSARVAGGRRRTGITIMRMEAGLDTGPMLARARLDIGAGDTAGKLARPAGAPRARS